MSIPSSMGAGPNPDTPKAGDERAEIVNPWDKALALLSDEDQKQLNTSSDAAPLNMLDVLKSVQEATERRQEACIERGWTVYRNKNGEEVKLLHILQKMSTWVKEAMKIVDVGISFDQSGHAALPWAIVKLIIEAGFSSVEVFGSIVEGIEFASDLITRYTVVEKLYLHQGSDSTPRLHEAITKLYANVLIYLSNVKAYYMGNTWKKIARSLKEAISKQYDDLKSKISETEVEKWMHLIDAEIQRTREEASFKDHIKLREILIELNKPIIQMRTQVSMIQDRLNSDERIKVFHWMSKIEYKHHHDDLSKGLVAQSGQWLLESKHFIEWVQSSVSSILWLHGIPGSGKTRLVSIVIKFLNDAAPNPSTSPTAFFYCARSTAEPERAKPAAILSALLRQLASSQSDMPVKKAVVKEFEARKNSAAKDGSALKKLTVEDCTRLIVELANSYPLTIILDALDECEEDTRYELLDAFDEIISKSRQVVKILVSSRDDIDIKMRLEHSKNISVGVENNSGDITRFVYSEVDRLVSNRLLLDGNIPRNFRHKIIRTLINGAQGMFRWVELSLETLKRIKFLPDFRQALGQLPSSLADLYNIIHTQIDQTETYGRDLATQTFKWLLCCQRLLTAEELIAAVYKVDEDTFSDSDGDSERPEQDAPCPSPENDILRLCRNLVIFDSEQRIFRFSHQSVREYLLKQPQYTAAEQHNLAAERCLDIYLTEWLESSITPKTEQSNDILRRYAELYWPVHFKHVEGSQSTQLKKSISRFTTMTQGKSIAYDQWQSDLRSRFPGYRATLPGFCSHLENEILFIAREKDTLLAVASAFGIPYFVQLHESLENPSHQCLAFAASQGHYQVVQLLLDKGAELELKRNIWGEMSALKEACVNGFENIVRLLLDNGADIAKGGYNGTALHVASKNDRYQIVQMLLDRGADVNAQGGDHGSALQLASCYGGYQIVQMLLDRGADINAQAGDYGTALQAASSNGHYGVVQMLLDRGADINAQTINVGTALNVASSQGHCQIVQILLDRGADVDAQNWIARTALQEASSRGYCQIARLLLDRGADVNALSRYHGTALDLASDHGHEQIVQTLLARGAKSSKVLPHRPDRYLYALSTNGMPEENSQPVATSDTHI